MLRWVEAAVVVVEVVYHTTCVELLRQGHSSWTVLFFMNNSEEEVVTWRSSVDDVATENANECDQQMTRMIPTTAVTIIIMAANNHWRMGILAETIRNTMVVHFCGKTFGRSGIGSEDPASVTSFSLFSFD